MTPGNGGNNVMTIMARALAILTLSSAPVWTAGAERRAGHNYESDGARGWNAGVGGQCDHSGQVISADQSEASIQVT